MLIPCHDEEATVATVVADFRRVLPAARVYVYDNASTDATSSRAKSAGAVARYEPKRGKGNVVRRMFADVEADVYVVVDGDGSYDAEDAPKMVEQLLTAGLDMVVGARRPDPACAGVYRRGHATGNAWLTGLVRLLFGGDHTDVLSGYRVLSRRFVKSLPVFSDGFEIETEMTAHATRVRAACRELPTVYRGRPGGSESKLHTCRDGLRILVQMVKLYEEIRPLQFFGACFAALTAVSLALGVPVVDEFARTGAVARFPTAFLALGIQIVAFICLASGIILRNVGQARDEARRLAYLSTPAPHSAASEAAASPSPAESSL